LPAPRASDGAGNPNYMVDERGYLKKPFRKQGRTAFPEVSAVGQLTWAFSKMGYV